MKNLLLFILLFLAQRVSAQDTLYHHVPMLGSEKYVLHADGTFRYVSSLCGYTYLSYGSYRKKLFGYTFDYDTTKCPKPAIVGLKEASASDQLVLFFYDMTDSLPLPYYGLVIIGDQLFESQSDSLIIPKNSIHSNTLILNGEFYIKDPTFTFDPTSTRLNIYLNPAFCECMTNGIRKLKRTKHGYLHRYIVYDEIREKPWKRGKKRIVKNYYQLQK